MAVLTNDQESFETRLSFEEFVCDQATLCVRVAFISEAPGGSPGSDFVQVEHWLDHNA